MLVPNNPSREGREAGKQLARLADSADADRMAKFPGSKPRCKTCAFRAGTFPNGCTATVGDALKAVAEQSPFYCHQKRADAEPTELCAGWVACVGALAHLPPTTLPYEYSHVDN